MQTIKVLLTAFFFIIFLQLNAQFVTPLTSLSGDIIVTNVDDQVYEGKIKNAVNGPNGLVSFKLKDSNGTDHKFKAEDVKELKIKVDGMARLEIVAEQTSNLKKLAHSNFKEVVQRDYIIWQQFTHPKSKKLFLLQLLNPGFDSKIKVYQKPNAKTGAMSVGNIDVSGGEATAYYVLKGSDSYEISKRKYQKEGYQSLFSDCTQMNNEKPKFKEFAIDVFTYDQACH